MGKRGVWVLVLMVACSSSGRSGHGGGGSDGGTAPPDGGVDCSSTSTDLTGCGCAGSEMRACYPRGVDPSTRNVGACHDGTQMCTAAGEFGTFGACMGAVVPTTEICNDQIDNNCDGKVDCADPTCATNPLCDTGCTDGQTRSCYDGPSGSLGVGTCKAGMQTCAGGQWPSTCPGEVLPMPEQCSDALDHNCNGLAGCLDIFSCLTSSACQSTCTASMVDPGCVCPTGEGDTATCPDGMFGVLGKGATLTSPGMDECCPCTANDCGNAGCCAETVCAGNASCTGLVCTPLPASCNGQVNADCDDFPEDCDEPCCKCTSCSTTGM